MPNKTGCKLLSRVRLGNPRPSSAHFNYFIEHNLEPILSLWIQLPNKAGILYYMLNRKLNLASILHIIQHTSRTV